MSGVLLYDKYIIFIEQIKMAMNTTENIIV